MGSLREERSRNSVNSHMELCRECQGTPSDYFTRSDFSPQVGLQYVGCSTGFHWFLTAEGKTYVGRSRKEPRKQRSQQPPTSSASWSQNILIGYKLLESLILKSCFFSMSEICFQIYIITFHWWNSTLISYLSIGSLQENIKLKSDHSSQSSFSKNTHKRLQGVTFLSVRYRMTAFN